MSQSLATIYIHATFSTKNREPFLAPIELRRNAHAFMAGVSRKRDCAVIEVGGVEDHVHVLFRLARTENLSDWMREVKRASSSHIKSKVPSFSWQAGYGAFSVDPTRLAQIATYVREQEAHHQKVSFQDEFRALLREHDLEWDERYVWD